MHCTRVASVCLVSLLLCKETCFSLVSLQLLRGGIWACMRCPCLCFIGFWDGDYVDYVGVKSRFQHPREE